MTLMLYNNERQSEIRNYPPQECFYQKCFDAKYQRGTVLLVYQKKLCNVLKLDRK